jgi:hypothetical protein
LAKLLWAGELDGVWAPDERRVMRRRRRAQVVRARSRAKNEIHAVLMRCLKDRPPAADRFGVRGRRWLGDQRLAVCERETVDAGLRQVDFLDSEIAQVDQLIVADALGLSGGQAADERPRRQRDRCGDVHGRYERELRRHPCRARNGADLNKRCRQWPRGRESSRRRTPEHCAEAP